MVLESPNVGTGRGLWSHLIQLSQRKKPRHQRHQSEGDQGQGLTHCGEGLGNNVPEMSVTIILGEVRRAGMVLSSKTSIWHTELNVGDNSVPAPPGC